MADENDQETRRAQRRAKQGETSATEKPEVEPTAVELVRDRNARLREQAAAERRAQREESTRGRPAAAGLDASERMDDLFVRTTHVASDWVRKNFYWAQYVIVGGVVLGFGYQGYNYYRVDQAAKNGDALMQGLEAEMRPVAPKSSAEAMLGLSLPEAANSFPSEEARLSAAEQGYRATVKNLPKSSAASFAEFSLAGLLYDQKKFDEALQRYRTARGSELLRTMPDVSARALEGIGLCQEAKGERDAALQTFKELAGLEGVGNASAYGMYHEARLLLAKGKQDELTPLMKRLDERVKSDTERGEGFLARMVGQLHEQIAPGASRQGELERMLKNLKTSQPIPANAQPVELPRQAPAGPTEVPPAAPAGDPAPLSTGPLESSSPAGTQ